MVVLTRRRVGWERELRVVDRRAGNSGRSAFHCGAVVDGCFVSLEFGILIQVKDVNQIGPGKKSSRPDRSLSCYTCTV